MFVLISRRDETSIPYKRWSARKVQKARVSELALAGSCIVEHPHRGRLAARSGQQIIDGRQKSLSIQFHLVRVESARHRRRTAFRRVQGREGNERDPRQLG